MSKVGGEDLIIIGKIIKPHGWRGLLRVNSYAESPDSFLEPGIVFIKSISGDLRPHRVLSLKPHKNAFLLKLQDIDSLEEAGEHTGEPIYKRKNDLKRNRDGDEFFWYELIGLNVYSTEHQYIGRLVHIFSTGSNDVYVVRDGEKEVLIPAIHDVIEAIDLEDNRMTIHEVEGLMG